MGEQGRISEEFILKTIEFWRRKAGMTLSREDALEAIINAAALFRELDHLEKETQEKASTSESKEVRIEL